MVWFNAWHPMNAVKFFEFSVINFGEYMGRRCEPACLIARGRIM